MAQERIELENLKSAVSDKGMTAKKVSASSEKPSEKSGPSIDALGRSYATGKRKNAIARVWIKPGSGKITVNGRESQVYFARPVLQMMIDQPFKVSGRQAQFDVICTVAGGGLSGQAGAIIHGIARAIVEFEPELKTNLKKEKLTTRDSRAVERKKYGRRKARRSFQFSKR